MTDTNKSVSDFTRREMLAAGSLAVGSVALSGRWPTEATAADSSEPIQGFSTYQQLLDAITQKGHKLHTLGYCHDGSPVVAVKVGGDKTPAIFISAGSHSTEHAGPLAAIDLLDSLQTDHAVYVIPCRDPMGLQGFRHVLGFGLGAEPDVSTMKDVEALLRKEGEILYDAEGRLLVLIGDYGYANTGFHQKVEKGARFLDPLKGRRLYFPSNDPQAPGAGPLQRAYTQIVTPDGEVLHINRFHDTAWAPVEVRCTRNLMAEVNPGLVFDLHEYGGSDFWMSARRQKTDEDEIWERRLAHEAVQAVVAGGGTLASEEYSPGSFFDKLEPGVFWLDASKRGEGLNLADFSAKKYGLAFTIETGMRQPFAKRIGMHRAVVQSAVRVFEERYA